MEAKDLRIGNWVLENGSFHQIEINDFYNPQLFKPIELTEEILLKCGFSFDRKKNYFYISFNDISQFIEIYECADDSGNLFVAYLTNDDIETENSNPIFLLYINNLHQLQNLYFALTNEELEINL